MAVFMVAGGVAEITGGDKLKAALDKIAANLSNGAEVEVGFMSGASYPDGTSIAAVAAFNEFGTANSPPRPFFRNAIVKNSGKWPKNVATALKANSYDAVAALDSVGFEIEDEIRLEIRSNTPPPNAPSTVAAKGFSRTLIADGTMLNSVTHNARSGS